MRLIIRKFFCYNWSESGHLSYDGTKPKREKGSCFKCDSIDHTAKNCHHLGKKKLRSKTNGIRSENTMFLSEFFKVWI